MIRKKIEQPDGPVIFTVSGIVTEKAVLRTLKDMLEDPEFKSGMDVIWDFSGGETTSMTSQDIRELVTFIKTNQEKRGSGYKVGLVVARDLDYGLARIYQAYSQELPFNLQIFRSRQEAYCWIKGSEK